MATERESVNFKLSKSLVDALRAQAKERNTSATELVVQGLHLILGQTESIDFSSSPVIDVMHDIITRLEALEASRATDATATVNGIEDRLHQISAALEHLANSICQFADKVKIVADKVKNCRGLIENMVV